jgi:hypothetical protein
VKGSVPLRYWVLWWSILGVAMLVFYVLLTPVWIGLRVVAWLAEQRARHAPGRSTSPEPAPRPPR